MSEPVRSPERRTDAPILCLCIGGGLMALGWFLGAAGAFSQLLSTQWSAIGTGGVMALLLLPFALLLGFGFAVVGGIWILVQVIADQTSARDPYSKNVER